MEGGSASSEARPPSESLAVMIKVASILSLSCSPNTPVTCSKQDFHRDHPGKVLTGPPPIAKTARLVAVLLAAVMSVNDASESQRLHLKLRKLEVYAAAGPVPAIMMAGPWHCA